MIYYTAQAIGFIGLILAVISFQKNSNKEILFFQVLSCFIFFVSFLLMGVYTGAVMNLLGAIRNIVFVNSEKKWAQNTLWIYIFIVVYIISGILTWNNIYSILPTIAMVFSTIALWNKNPKITRLILIFCSPCWLIYNIANKSIAAIITELFIFTSISVGIIRFDILKKSENVMS